MDQCIKNRCYMCIQWRCVLYSVVITGQSNPPISKFNSPYNEFTSVSSMFVYNSCVHSHKKVFPYNIDSIFVLKCKFICLRFLFFVTTMLLCL